MQEEKMLQERQFLEQVAFDLGVKELSDWYTVPRYRVAEKGDLLDHYPSLEAALKAAYPHHHWESARFRNVSSDKETLLAALHRAEGKLGIQQPEDWYSVALADLRELGLPNRMTKTHLAGLLAQKYPTFEWDSSRFLKGRFAQQRRLEIVVTSLFPGEHIRRNVRKGAGLISTDTGEYLELDVYIPSLKLAFEYQERHHYENTEYTDVNAVQRRDRLKMELATAQGITLIVVPFWWNTQASSLVAMIKKVRPELLKGSYLSAEEQPPPPPELLLGLRGARYVEDIGEPLTATFLTRSNIDPTNWWLFEKYDGIRGFWNPLRKAFFSRNGHRLRFPQHIVDTMPQDIFLDGEIWFGPNNFQEAAKISNAVDSSAIDWSKFKYMVFDQPKNGGVYQQRYSALDKYFQEHPNPFVTVAPAVPCTGMEHLEEFFQRIIDQGGEGVILRDPLAGNEAGRSKGYLKHKKYRDAEARIIRKTGLHWECELPNGILFTALPGTSLFEKQWKPAPGDIVSFKHHGFLFGSKRPKLATLYRVRRDVTWEQVVANWKEQKVSIPSTGIPRIRKFLQKPKGYWTDLENVKAFFDSFAKEKGFDPRDAKAWRKVNLEDMRQGGGSIQTVHRGFKRALKLVYPEVDL